MKVTRFIPKPPPMFRLEFTHDEGWALVMALSEAVDKHKEAVDREQWRQWAKDLDAELRRG